MHVDVKLADRTDRRVGDHRMDKIQATQEHLKCTLVAHEYKLDALLEHFLKAMTVIYRLQIASEGAKVDSRRRGRTMDEINHRLAVIDQNLCGMREQRPHSRHLDKTRCEGV